MHYGIQQWDMHRLSIGALELLTDDYQQQLAREA